MHEKTFRQSLINNVRKKYIYVKAMETNNDGFPDILIHFSNTMLLAELKYVKYNTTGSIIYLKDLFQKTQASFYIDFLKYNDIGHLWYISKVEYKRSGNFQNIDYYYELACIDKFFALAVSSNRILHEDIHEHTRYYKRFESAKEFNDMCVNIMLLYAKAAKKKKEFEK